MMEYRSVHQERQLVFLSGRQKRRCLFEVIVEQVLIRLDSEHCDWCMRKGYIPYFVTKSGTPAGPCLFSTGAAWPTASKAATEKSVVSNISMLLRSNINECGYTT